MTLIDKAVLILENDVTGDGNTNTGEFHIETDVEVQKEIRTSHLLDNSLDRVLGAINELLGADESVKRSGITIDTGGGKTTHQISFTEPDGGTNRWGDGGSNAQSDATGESARRKAEVLERYLKTGTYDSSQPAKLKFGEYNSSGEYEEFIPVALDNMRLTVSAEEEATLDGQIKVFEVGTLGGQDSSVSRDPF